MNISELSVKKPKTVIVGLILFLGLGILGFFNLKAELLPSVDTSTITITTQYNGAGVEEIRDNVIKPIEDAIVGISGVDNINSTATEGMATVMVQFTEKTKINDAYLDVQQALSDVENKLPKDASSPVLKKMNINMMPPFVLAVTGDIPYDELYLQADKMGQALKTLNGVGDVTLTGAYKKELHINIDKKAIEHYGVNINTVLNTIKMENSNTPGGEIKTSGEIFNLKVNGNFTSIKEVENLPISLSTGGQIRIEDIAEVTMEYPEVQNYQRFNGEQSIGINIQKQEDANIVAIAQGVEKKITEIKKELPANVKVTMVKDQSKFVKGSQKSLYSSLAEAIFTTSLVMLLFLKKWRPALIVLISIPTSLISTFFMVYIFGLTLNMMTLLALSLCVGILVDDSIVVIENIERHLKLGKNPITAAIEGRKEIAMAAIAITLCDVVVFGPVGFATGMAGNVLRQFGLTIVSATLLSLLISFTLTPMLASKLLKSEDRKEEEKKSWIAIYEEKMMEVYKSLLIKSLDHRNKIIFLVIGCLVASISLIPLKVIKAENVPVSDMSGLTINLTVRAGAPLEFTESKVKEIETYLKSREEIADIFSTVGIDNNKSSAQIIINLVPKEKREKSQTKIVEEVRQWCSQQQGFSFTVLEADMMGNTSSDTSKAISIKVTGSDEKVLKKISEEVELKLQKIEGITDIENSAASTKKEFNVKVDRLAASEIGITTSELGGILRTAVNGSDAGVYRKNGNEFDMVVKFTEKTIVTKEELSNIKVIGTKGKTAYLGQLADIEIIGSYQKQLRYNRKNMIKVSANLQNKKLSDVNEEMESDMSKISIPEGYEIDFAGDVKNMKDTFTSLIIIIIVAMILVYMILIVLYESYLTPFIRLLSLPCAAIGALFALAITGTTFNMMTLIGLIMLDGLASKNGTLLIDYTNTLMKQGKSLREALLEAGVSRIKPIVMTTVTMLVGMFPLATSRSDGNEMFSGMAIIIIGGMLSSTIFSPLLLPAVYTIMDDARQYFSRKKHRVEIKG